MTAERAREAYQLLNSAVLDLVCGTGVIDLYNSPRIQSVITSDVELGVTRMTLSHLILTLSKINEVYRRYKALIPQDVSKQFKSLQREIQSRQVVEFRNKVVGHIWDDDLNRPLLDREILAILNTVTGGDTEAFLRWINPASDPSPGSVVGTVERVRDSIGRTYEIRSRSSVENRSR
ncbi:hypothetical protein HKW67_17370 [Gemmatimonas groenlandica]|uniref:Uncharacterized protein n=1 Tax=Gemmatimonas groenlandica TaxID=2732249 RepID=A0A6M4IY44_9BACT|nr:hypothetical protein HKW67_17370 [Gemmatimonas groenlandica]